MSDPGEQHGDSGSIAGSGEWRHFAFKGFGYWLIYGRRVFESVETIAEIVHILRLLLEDGIVSRLDLLAEIAERRNSSTPLFLACSPPYAAITPRPKSAARPKPMCLILWGGMQICGADSECSVRFRESSMGRNRQRTALFRGGHEATPKGSRSKRPIARSTAGRQRWRFPLEGQPPYRVTDGRHSSNGSTRMESSRRKGGSPSSSSEITRP